MTQVFIPGVIRKLKPISQASRAQSRDKLLIRPDTHAEASSVGTEEAALEGLPYANVPWI